MATRQHGVVALFFLVILLVLIVHGKIEHAPVSADLLVCVPIDLKLHQLGLPMNTSYNSIMQIEFQISFCRQVMRQ